MPARFALAGLTLSLLATIAGGAARAAAPPGPCSGTTPPPRYEHVVWIWMENKPREDVIGSSQAPYENRLVARCGTAVDYRGVTHPSLPNYIAATSGNTWGIADDDGPASHPLTAASIFSQARSWRSYQEGAPGPCPHESLGRYAQKHDPALYYTRLARACGRNDVPLGTMSAGALVSDLAHGHLPAFSLITPDLCDDTHDCPVATGDAWLGRWVTRLVASRPYRSGTTALFIVWDEGERAEPLPFVAVAPAIPPGTRARGRVDHYALLRATEDLLGLRPLGHARDPGASGLARALHLER